MRVLSKHPGFKPLLYAGERLVLGRGAELFISDLDLKDPHPLCTLPVTRHRWATGTAFLRRLARIAAGPAILDPGTGEMLTWFSGRCYRVDLETGAFTAETVNHRGRRPLQVAVVDQPGFTQGIYLGEYFVNPDKGPALIWRCEAGGVWKAVYEFPPGAINHVHGVYPHPGRDCVYVLTGDYGAAAAIWKTEDDFATLTPILSGDQSARACWLALNPQGLIYATDTHMETNFVYRLEMDGPALQRRKLFPIMGSSIYAPELAGPEICFSTSIEPPPGTGFKPYDMLTRRRGPGILSDHACVYYGTPDQGFDIVLKARKDAFPANLFGFGAFLFPGGLPPRPGLLHAYGIALEGADDTTFVLGD